MKTKKAHIWISCFLLIVMVGATCNEVDIKGGEFLSAPNVIGHPLHIARLQSIGGVSIRGELSPWIMLTSGGNSLELCSSMTTEEDADFWPTISVERFKNEDFIIVTGELKMQVKNITWAIIINKTN